MENVDNDTARTLLASERARVEELIAGLGADRSGDVDEASESGDWADRAEPITTEGTDDAVAASLTERLRAIDRAEARLTAGTYGRSVRSGAVIPDARLEADPAAELTVEEAAEDEASGG
jgi:DnaK suppressor protein